MKDLSVISRSASLTADTELRICFYWVHCILTPGDPAVDCILKHSDSLKEKWSEHRCWEGNCVRKSHTLDRELSKRNCPATKTLNYRRESSSVTQCP